MSKLTYNDVLELLGYTEPERHALEILGYEHSTRGRQQFDAERPDIQPSLTDAICDDLKRSGVFPRRFGFRRPEYGAFIERRGDDFVLIDRDKPSIETRWTYKSAHAAARALVRKRCDHGFLLRPEETDECVSVEYT